MLLFGTIHILLLVRLDMLEFSDCMFSNLSNIPIIFHVYHVFPFTSIYSLPLSFVFFSFTHMLRLPKARVGLAEGSTRVLTIGTGLGALRDGPVHHVDSG